MLSCRLKKLASCGRADDTICLSIYLPTYLSIYLSVCLFDWKHWKNTVKNMFWIYLSWSWLPALEHGKIEENTVNSGIFNGWGDKGIGSIVEHDVFDRFYGDKSVKYRALKETIAKTWKHIQRTRDLGDYLGVVVYLSEIPQLGEPPREGKVKIP